MFRLPKIFQISVVAIFVLASFYTPLVNKQAVPKAEALFGLGGVGGGPVTVIGGPGTVSDKITSLKSTISAAAASVTAGNSVTFLGKEFFLDGIAFELAQLMLQQITASIVTWINSGFQGSPAFLSDFKGFMRDIADQEFGKLIDGTELDFMCSPFKLDVKIALAVQYQANQDFSNQVQCTLSDVVDNVDGFVNGTFSDGGWAGWLELTQHPQNTPYGAYLAAEGELNARIVDAQGREIKQLDWGQGTFSKTLCELVEGAGAKQENCFINMPGKYISESLTFTVQGAQRKLITADEINEIVGALFAQLAQQAITGVNGLLGLSQPGYTSNGGSYLDAVQAENTATDDSSLVIFEQTYQDELDYQALFVGVADEVDALAQTNITNRNSYPSCYNLTLPTIITDTQTEALATASSSDDILYIIDSMISILSASSTTPEQKQEVYTQYQTMQINGDVHSPVDIAQAENDLSEYDTAVSDFKTAMDSEIKRCQELKTGGSDFQGR